MKVSVFAAICVVLAVSLMPAATPVAFPLFIGTYGKTAGAGIYRVTFDPTSGALSEPHRVADLVRPSFLAYSPDRKKLYAINHGDDSIVAFAVDSAIGTLREINRQPLDAGGSCYVGVAPTARTLVAISYGDAVVTAFPIRADGGLEPRSAQFRHEGRGPNEARQEKAHAHSVTFSPDGRFGYVCDLGMDRVVAYRLGDQPGEIVRAPEADGVTPPGTGPRHSKMTADGRYLYVINELSGSVSVFRRDPDTGRLELIETVSSLREGFQGENGSSEIHLHPEERFIFAANRGPDDLAVFARDPSTGRIQRIQNIATGGAHPRHFGQSRDGRWLIAANRDSNNLVVFSFDHSEGKLTPANHRTTVPEPVCVLFP